MANLQLSLVSPETPKWRKMGVEGSATIIRNISTRHRSGPLGARRCRRPEARNDAAEMRVRMGRMLTPFKSSRPDMISKTLQISVISLYSGGSKVHCYRLVKFAGFAAL
jgi:hypothetical protein